MTEKTNLALMQDFCRHNASSGIGALGGYLQAMEMFGHPKLSKLKDGWHSWIQVFVSGKGVEFEVKSDYGHKSPIDATRECSERLVKALNQIIETKGPNVAEIGD